MPNKLPYFSILWNLKAFSTVFRLESFEALLPAKWSAQTGLGATALLQRPLVPSLGFWVMQWAFLLRDSRVKVISGVQLLGF